LFGRLHGCFSVLGGCFADTVEKILKDFRHQGTKFFL